METRLLQRRIQRHIETLNAVAEHLPPMEIPTDERQAQRSRICLEVSMDEADRWARTLVSQVTAEVPTSNLIGI